MYDGKIANLYSEDPIDIISKLNPVDYNFFKDNISK